MLRPVLINPSFIMPNLIIEIPQEIMEALRFPPGEAEREVRKELALALYERQVLSLGKARQLAGLTRWEFEELLGERRIPRQYTKEDLRDDVAPA